MGFFGGGLVFTRRRCGLFNKRMRHKRERSERKRREQQGGYVERSGCNREAEKRREKK